MSGKPEGMAMGAMPEMSGNERFLKLLPSQTKFHRQMPVETMALEAKLISAAYRGIGSKAGH